MLQSLYMFVVVILTFRLMCSVYYSLTKRQKHVKLTTDINLNKVIKQSHTKKKRWNRTLFLTSTHVNDDD